MFMLFKIIMLLIIIILAFAVPLIIINTRDLYGDLHMIKFLRYNDKELNKTVEKVFRTVCLSSAGTFVIGMMLGLFLCWLVIG